MREREREKEKDEYLFAALQTVCVRRLVCNYLFLCLSVVVVCNDVSLSLKKFIYPICKIIIIKIIDGMKKVRGKRKKNNLKRFVKMEK